MKQTYWVLVLAISAAFVMTSCAPYISTGPKEKLNYAFVISCELVERQGICLLGKHKAGIPVSLLNVNDSKVCGARTSKSSSYDGGAWHPLTFTEIAAGHECRPPDQYSIAVLGPELGGYEMLQMREITDEQTIKVLNDAVRRSPVLESLRTEATGEINEIQNESPRLFQYPHPDIGILIVAYDESQDKSYPSGPRAILFNGVPYPLTGWCSYPFMRAFRLNGDYYLESGSCCCGCGITVKELFKIGPSGPVNIHSDSSLSD